MQALAERVSFKIYPPGSQTHETVGDCGWGEFDALPRRQKVPENIPVLLVIGQQKAGTTWLYEALDTHPAVLGGFEGAGGRPGCAPAGPVLDPGKNGP